MDNFNEFETEFNKRITEPIMLKVNEVFNIIKSNEYFDYVSGAMQLSNKKWLYPTMSFVLFLETFTGFKYILNISKTQNIFGFAFIFCLMLNAGFGYFFLKIKNSEVYSKSDNNIIFSYILLIILTQYFFYYSASVSSRSLVFFMMATLAIGLLPALSPKNLSLVLFINQAVYMLVISKYYFTLFNGNYLLGSIIISFCTFLFGIYSYISRLNILVSSKKMASYAKNMAISNSKLNYLNSELNFLNSKLEKMSLTDELTKIGNRRHFEIETEKLWSNAMRSNSYISIFLLDVDFFKLYNDHFGHPQGDVCLAKVAASVNSCFKRKSDVVARYGGEEFVVVLPFVDPEQAKAMADRILNAIRNLKLPHPRSAVSPHVTLSIGISSVIPDRGTDYKSSFDAADQALYEAKRSGRNKYCISNNYVNSGDHTKDNKLNSFDKKDSSFTCESEQNTDIINNLLDGKYVIDIKNNRRLIFGHITEFLSTNENPESEKQLHKNDFQNLENALCLENKNIFKDFINDIMSGIPVDLDFEYKIKGKNKETIWISSRNKIYYDTEGKVFLIIGLLYNLNTLEIYNKSLRSEHYISPVSGLPDRTKFFDDLENILLSKKSKGFLFLMDIDNFNNVNSIFSYSEGNRFLKNVGKLLNENKSFFGKVYHFEGDLFAIIFPNMLKEQAVKQMSVYRELSEKPIECRGIAYQYSLSISCIEYPAFGDSVEELLRNGDMALHRIKIGGKNNMLVFSNELYEENNTRLNLEMELRRSVDNNMEGFELYYHPLLSAETNTCIGAEALIRWRSPEGKIFPPAAFLQSLENAGLMNKVGEWVLKTASLQCKNWILNGDLENGEKLHISENFSISINISAHQLVSDYFEENLLNYLNQIELDCKHIILEITESALIMDIQKGIKILSSLRRKGIKIAIDDFGTGYSSLSYFRDLPVDEIKIDRSFIIDIENDNFCREFVNSIIKITQSIDRVICVEGVENEMQAEILRGFKANILQGYLYSKPIPKSEFEYQFLKSEITVL